ncbi:hypothetical protein A1OE_972 [Candidatus Endolissoclinum faulkneri L2]|uniref:Uncharacterized protein n=1 Tax=Candidatus Endolissoclinum faulkneri L2 TaxID=1193729 RepID=K7Z527_9PROT|nr:hypothetical protein A1OE_972 [Candidatus Endolissoclinum faulkneri L2]
MLQSIVDNINFQVYIIDILQLNFLMLMVFINSKRWNKAVNYA